MGFSTSSVLVKVAFGLCIAALLFHLISFPSHYWIDQSGVSSGLFQICYIGKCYTIPEAEKADYVKAVIAMDIMAFLAGVACLVLTICFLFVKSLATETVKNVCLALAFVAALLILIGLVVFAARKNEIIVRVNYGWSFFLEIVAALLYVATGIAFFMDIFFS